MTADKVAVELHIARERSICPFLSSNQTVWDSKFVKCLRMKCALFAGRTCSLAIVKTKREPTKYNMFVSEKMKTGLSMKDTAQLWKEQKEAQL